MSLIPEPLRVPPFRVLTTSPAHCDGAAVVEVVTPQFGEVRRDHQVVCLERWLSPFSVRPLRSAGGWDMLQPGSRLWCPDEPKYFERDGSSKHQFVFITKERVEFVLERPYAACAMERWSGRYFEDPLVNHLLSAMAHDSAEHSPAGPLIVDSLVVALVGRLASSAPPVPVRTRLSPARLRRVLEFIEASMHRPLRLDELAEQANIGVSLFCRTFRNALGTSPHQYLLQRRIERAKHLMRDPSLSLIDIALAVGFSNQSQFTRVFSRLVGVSPGRYRQVLPGY